MEEQQAAVLGGKFTFILHSVANLRKSWDLVIPHPVIITHLFTLKRILCLKIKFTQFTPDVSKMCSVSDVGFFSFELESQTPNLPWLIDYIWDEGKI